jgi:hypothetical protein
MRRVVLFSSFFICSAAALSAESIRMHLAARRRKNGLLAA